MGEIERHPAPGADSACWLFGDSRIVRSSRRATSAILWRDPRLRPAAVVLTAVLAVVFALSSGCQEKVKPGSVEVKRPVIEGVTVTEVALSTVDELYDATGTVKAKTTSVISSRVMGTVTSVRVREGDRVSAGQVLVTVDDRDAAQRLRAAEKAAEVAQHSKSLSEVTYGRYKTLYDEKALTRQELDQIETQKKVAEAEYERALAGLAEAKVALGFAQITSPVSGVVVDRKIDPGSMAAPGVPLLTVEDSSSFTIDIFVDEHLSGRLHKGAAVDLFVSAVPQQPKGRIIEIVPAVDPASRTFLVKVEASGPGLKSGHYAKVRIPAGKREALVVPSFTVVEKGQLSGVYAVDEKGLISYRLIKQGKRFGEGVEVLSGLSPKEKIITAGIEKAVDGGIVAAQGGSPSAR